MPQHQRDHDDKRRNVSTAMIGGVISGIVRAVTDRLIQLVEQVISNS